MKRALITGITGQDGSYLAEFLLAKGYEVHGVIRRTSTFNTKRIDHLYRDPHEPGSRLFLHYGDLSDGVSIVNLVHEIQPDEIYHLGAQSHVRVSFDLPEYTGEVTGLSTARLLETIRRSGVRTRLYNAASSEMYGRSLPPQNESTPFRPSSPYGAAKLYGYWMTVNYREAYGIFACNGILFNHESPRRGATFVTRKITQGLAKVMAGQQQFIFLGNLEAKRDWGYAPEYVETMWLMLQQDEPDDYVVGTGECHTVQEFLDEAANYSGVDWRDFVKIDPKYFRPTEVDILMADASKAFSKLNWRPRTTFQELVKILMDADLQAAGLESPGAGVAILARNGLTQYGTFAIT